MNFWVPPNKKELLKWLKQQYPDCSFKGMSDKALYRKYYEAIKRHEGNRVKEQSHSHVAP